jgi:hypothetical protein
MENNIPEQNRISVNTPIHDPSLAALLVALDFPLVRPRFAVQPVDLSSQHRDQTVDHDSWIFGNTSPTHGPIAAALTQFQSSFPRHDANLTTLQRAKLALHNRRVIKLAAQQMLPLHKLELPSFVRLSSWRGGSVVPVPEDYDSVLPRIFNTDLVALATAFGHTIASTARYMGQLGFLLQTNLSAPYSIPEIEAKFKDRDYIRANSDPLAVASAAVISFKTLFKAAKAGGETLVLHKNGRYATLPKNATDAEKIAVAQHLST